MSYSVFLSVVLVPPILVLGALFYKVRAGITAGRALRAVFYVVVIAVTYTTPWDSYLIYRDVWWYGPDRVLGTIGYVPVEEYGFMVLQAVMTGLLTVLVFRRDESGGAGRRGFVAGLAAWIGAAAAGFVMLFGGSERWLYLGLILAWAGPVLAGTWWLGGRRFLAARWRYAAAFGLPSMYLWLWDAFAIEDGIWSISPVYTLGLGLGPLPIEEAVFFLLTNVLVVQGVLLFWKDGRNKKFS